MNDLFHQVGSSIKRIDRATQDLSDAIGRLLEPDIITFLASHAYAKRNAHVVKALNQWNSAHSMIFKAHLLLGHWQKFSDTSGSRWNVNFGAWNLKLALANGAERYHKMFFDVNVRFPSTEEINQLPAITTSHGVEIRVSFLQTLRQHGAWILNNCVKSSLKLPLKSSVSSQGEDHGPDGSSVDTASFSSVSSHDAASKVRSAHYATLMTSTSLQAEIEGDGDAEHAGAPVVETKSGDESFNLSGSSDGMAARRTSAEQDQEGLQIAGSDLEQYFAIIEEKLIKSLRKGDIQAGVADSTSPDGQNPVDTTTSDPDRFTLDPELKAAFKSIDLDDVNRLGFVERFLLTVTRFTQQLVKDNDSIIENEAPGRSTVLATERWCALMADVEKLLQVSG